jgi:hypothetical protein
LAHWNSPPLLLLRRPIDDLVPIKEDRASSSSSRVSRVSGFLSLSYGSPSQSLSLTLPLGLSLSLSGLSVSFSDSTRRKKRKKTKKKRKEKKKEEGSGLTPLSFSISPTFFSICSPLLPRSSH